MPDTVTLRFRDLETADAIAEHRRVISSAGYVWWGWWRKDTEPDHVRNIEELKARTVNDPFALGLFNRATSSFYLAELVDCVGSREPIASPEFLKTPSYYADARLPAWFKLTSIEKVDEVRFVRLFEGVPLGEGTFFPVWQGRPTVPPSTPDWIKLRSASVLHLSDVHLGADFDFPKVTKPGATELLDLIQRDFEVDPPGLVLISGDLTTRADANVLLNDGLPFFRDLAERLKLPPECIVIIPGNHDIPLGEFSAHDYSHENSFKFFLKEFYGREIQYPDFRRFVLSNGQKLELLAINSVRLRRKTESNFGYVQWQLYEDVLNATPHDPDVFRLATLHHHLVPALREETLNPDYPEASISTTLDAGAVIMGLQRHSFQLAVHGHQHVPAATRVARGRLGAESTSLEGLDTSLVVVAAGSAGAVAHRLSDEMRDNSYNVIRFGTSGIEVEARRYTKSSEPRTYFKFTL